MFHSSLFGSYHPNIDALPAPRLDIITKKLATEVINLFFISVPPYLNYIEIYKKRSDNVRIGILLFE